MTGIDPGEIVRAIEGALLGVSQPAGAILFASGALAETPEATVNLARAALGPVPAVFGTGAGVLTDRGEHERTTALAGIVWSGGTPSTIVLRRTPEKGATSMAARIATALEGRPGSVFLCAEPGDGASRAFEDLSEQLPNVSVVGAGTLPGGAWALPATGKPQSGPVVAMVMRGSAKPVVRASPGCKLLGPLVPITECRGAMVLRIGDKPALEALSKSARGVVGQPLVFAVLTEGEDDPRPGGGNLMIRGVRGVDPGRGGVIVTDEVRRGMRMCFAARDAGSARSDLESAVRDVARDAAGAAPRFGLLVTCGGRGIGLYGAADVDTAIVREKFPHVPMAGVFSTFEIGPFAGRTAMHLYTAVLALFSSPS